MLQWLDFLVIPMNATYSVTVTPSRDLDVSTIIQAEQCSSISECKNKMRELVLAKHPTYWKRIHRITAQYQGQILTLDPQEVVGFKIIQSIAA